MNHKSKIVSFETAVLVANGMRAKGEEIAFTNGVFDLAHIGHVRLLQFSRRFGTLIVGVNRDISVRALKGESRPINSENDRIELVAAFCYTEIVFGFSDLKVDNLIRAIRPTYWLKGCDYTMDTLDKDEVAAAKAVNTEIVFAPKLEGYSSTKIIERMKG